MTDPVPNGSELCTHGEELHAYCDKCASEQPPSKDQLTDEMLLTHARAYDQGPGATFEFDPPTLLSMLRGLAATVEGMIRDGAAPEPCAIRWTDEQDARCSYTHLIGHTPFGRVLITWKGWKEVWNMTLDESPWGASGYVGDTVESTKKNVEAEFNKRLLECRAAQPPRDGQ